MSHAGGFQSVTSDDLLSIIKRLRADRMLMSVALARHNRWKRSRPLLKVTRTAVLARVTPLNATRSHERLGVDGVRANLSNAARKSL
jgi:hypothetical protein